MIKTLLWNWAPYCAITAPRMCLSWICADKTPGPIFLSSPVTSSAQVQGLHKHIKDFAGEKDLEILRRQRKVPKDEEWSLIDLGNIVVHLMTQRARSFYELERLWSDAEQITMKSEQ